MSYKNDPDIQEAFDAIRRLFAGEHVPAPPRYFDDPGNELDIIRAAAWVAHALFLPDADGENVISTIVYDTRTERTVSIPNNTFSYKDMSISQDGWDINDILVATKSAHQVLMGACAEVTEEEIPRSIMPSRAETIIGMIKTRLDVIGRLADEQGWPDLNEEDVADAEDIIRTLVQAVTNHRFSSRSYARNSRVSVISYPVAGKGERHEWHAEMALSQIGTAIKGIADAYGHKRAEENRRRLQSEAEASTLAEIEKRKENLASRYAEAASAAGTPAGNALAAYLRDGVKMPVYKGTARFPSPERDEIIDSLHEMLGDDAAATLRLLISVDPKRVLSGLKSLGEQLETIFADSPSPF